MDNWKFWVLPGGVPDAGRARRRLSVIQVQKIDVNVTQFGVLKDLSINSWKGGLSSTNMSIKQSEAGGLGEQKQVFLVT